MDNVNIVILDTNSDFINELSSYLHEHTEFNVCAAAADGISGKEYIAKFKPVAVVLNLVLNACDGFSVLDYIRSNLPECKTIVAACFTDENLINSAIAHGANYYFVKPVSAESIADRIYELISQQSYGYNVADGVRDKRRLASVDEKISNIFISIGIPPHIKGYSYLREGIKMAIEDPAIINSVTKKLYPDIAKKFDTSASKVERAIRHAIEVAWNRGRIDAINAIFGARVYIGSERPTNSEFIALVADKLLLDELV